MPSISQAKLDEMAEAAASLTRQAHDADQRARRAEARVAEFDAILDKVMRAAQGRPLNDNRDGAYYANMGGYMEATGDRKIKAAERHEREVAALNERIIGLEARNAAAIAVASFARSHKA